MKNNKKAGTYISYLLGVFIASWQLSALADDSEIYSSAKPAANPNILFMLDTSGSMNGEDIDDGMGGKKSRMSVLQEVFADVITNAPANLNVGLLRYGGEYSASPSGISFPVKPIDAEALPIITDKLTVDQDNLPDPIAGQTVRAFLPLVVNSWQARGSTPIVDSFAEAARYYRGEQVSSFGALQPSHVRAAHPSTYTGNLSYDACASYSAPYACNNTAGACYNEIIPGSCANQWVDVGCLQFEATNDACCEWTTTSVNESGVGTVWECTGGYTCPGYNYANCLVPGGQVEAEICQTRSCIGQLAGTANYSSPLTSECQSNYIVFMSDGRPEGDNGIADYPVWRSLIETTVGKTCLDSPSGYPAGTCGPELAEYLANEDQSTAFAGKQTIETFTIAFALNDPAGTQYLQSLAEAGHLKVANNATELRKALQQVIAQATSVSKPVAAEPVYAAARPLSATTLVAQAAHDTSHPLVSTWALWKSFVTNPDLAEALLKLIEPSIFMGGAGGTPSLAATSNNFFHANNVKDLTSAFSSIIGRVQASASSFTSPTYKVDPNSYLAHSDEVFIPVFKRTPNAQWKGNLKKFKLENGVIVGKTGTTATQAAVDAQGQFLDSAWDFWGATASGSDVTGGGAASLLDPANRVLWTDNKTSLVTLDTTISKASLGDAAMTDTQHESLLEFIRGYNEDGTARQHLGDIMNSKPVMVRDSQGKSYVLAGSNEGYLHAFDTATGVEKWAFMPSVLLKNIKTLYENPLTTQHLYGVDGPLTVWYYDKNNDGQIKPDDQDKIYVYFGLRRGGSAYYALDITDMSAPSLAWVVDDTTAGFNNLGESWSKPVLAKMRVADADASTGSVLKDVLVFGGGFDPILEDENPANRLTHNKGHDVYIVNAHNGTELIWSLRADVSNAVMELKHSIPGDIRVLDMDQNGALDRLYFGDTGGHIWRVDLDVDVKDADTTTLYDYQKARLSQFANLGGSGSDKRMFYYEPDVAVAKMNGKDLLTLSIGSGYRSHPLSETINDRFYVLVDRQPFAEPDSAIFPIEETSSLVDVDTLSSTNNLLTDTSLTGWYYDLPNQAEKVLAPALTFMNKIVFTSFSIEEGNAGTCDVSTSAGRAYVMDLFSGAAVGSLDPSKPDEKVRSMIIGIDEIPDTPQLVFKQPMAADGSACTSSDCVQGLEVRIGKMQHALLDATHLTNGSNQAVDRIDLGNQLPRLFWLDRDVSRD
ncbi:Tfp pilus assembly protein, tip-associated adhesin PilY1 [Thiothrix eikelboomii]|uniref:Tfp pilus assembly protein, tip-associated adhesin PilY1 n=1 Tax=Thiothrix eikelboomii TaxID=92487 RepID=A0A1T4XTS0_9GAMM|nr:PilC/PilY family type IV pilus protein [Thiothrix eikelboomii]SKA92485.1 Tfp pilus assembly protein, tip-associated adhesin PilY1 [Thiothrix eikelboomii]